MGGVIGLSLLFAQLANVQPASSCATFESHFPDRWRIHGTSENAECERPEVGRPAKSTYSIVALVHTENLSGEVNWSTSRILKAGASIRSVKGEAHIYTNERTALLLKVIVAELGGKKFTTKDAEQWTLVSDFELKSVRLLTGEQLNRDVLVRMPDTVKHFEPWGGQHALGKNGLLELTLMSPLTQSEDLVAEVKTLLRLSLKRDGVGHPFVTLLVTCRPGSLELKHLQELK
jgi:hypothetical protein